MHFLMLGQLREPRRWIDGGCGHRTEDWLQTGPEQTKLEMMANSTSAMVHLATTQSGVAGTRNGGAEAVVPVLWGCQVEAGSGCNLGPLAINTSPQQLRSYF